MTISLSRSVYYFRKWLNFGISEPKTVLFGRVQALKLCPFDRSRKVLSNALVKTSNGLLEPELWHIPDSTYMYYDHSTCMYYVHSTCMYYDHSTCMYYDHSTCMYYDHRTCMSYDHSTCMCYDHSTCMCCGHSTCIMFYRAHVPSPLRRGGLGGLCPPREAGGLGGCKPPNGWLRTWGTILWSRGNQFPRPTLYDSLTLTVRTPQAQLGWGTN